MERISIAEDARQQANIEYAVDVKNKNVKSGDALKEQALHAALLFADTRTFKGLGDIDVCEIYVPLYCKFYLGQKVEESPESHVTLEPVKKRKFKRQEMKMNAHQRKH